MDRLNWDDVRVLLAVSRAGTVRAAAAELGTSHSTVLRRLSALESGLETRLFERGPSGYTLTEVGEQAVASSEGVESAMDDLRRRVQGTEVEVRGTVRVSLPHAILPTVLAASHRLAREWPAIDVELVTGTEFADLARREADLAVRIGGGPDESLVGVKVGRVEVGIFGSRRYARRVGDDRPIEELEWIGWERRRASMLGRWIDGQIPVNQIHLRLGTPSDLVKAVDVHLGVTLLPTVLSAGKAWHSFGSVEGFTAPVWVLTHADLRSTARVRAVRDFVVDTLRRSVGSGLDRP